MAESVLKADRITFIPVSNINNNDFNDIQNMTLGWVNQTISHAPENATTFAGHVFTYLPLRTHGFQIALRYNANDLYVRTLVDSAWGSWRRITITAEPATK